MLSIARPAKKKLPNSEKIIEFESVVSDLQSKLKNHLEQLSWKDENMNEMQSYFDTKNENLRLQHEKLST